MNETSISELAPAVGAPFTRNSCNHEGASEGGAFTDPIRISGRPPHVHVMRFGLYQHGNQRQWQGGKGILEFVRKVGFMPR